MFKKHRKTASMGLLQCCLSDSFQGDSIRIEREEIRLQKISLKQLKPAKASQLKTPQHKKTATKDELSFFQIINPKISFTYSSPRNISSLKKTVKIVKHVSDLTEQPLAVRAVLRIGNQQQSEKQQKEGIFLSPKLQQITQREEDKLEKVQLQSSCKQSDVCDSSSMKKLKFSHLQTPSAENMALERYKTNKKNGEHTQIVFEHSVAMKQHSQTQKSSSLERLKDVTKSENIDAVKKWKKANFFSNNKKVGNEGRVETKLNRQVFKKGKLFQRVRRLQTKFTQDDQSSSSHYSEVIQDYKSLLSKLQTNKLQDDELIQI